MDAESGNSNVEDTNQMPEENKSEPEPGEDNDYDQMYNDLIGKGDDYYQIWHCSNKSIALNEVHKTSSHLSISLRVGTPS